VKLPENTTSRAVQTMCPKCGELLSVPPMQARHAEDEHSRAADGRTTTATLTAREVREQLAGVTASSRNLSLLALGLGLTALLSLIVSCLPFVRYAGLGLAGLGLLVGLYATCRTLWRRERGVLYGIGGVAASGLALGLLLTQVLAPSPDQSSRPDDPTPTLLEQEKQLR
jgi:hypothetical protein